MNNNNTENMIESFFIGTILEDGYGYIPQAVMRDKTLHPYAKALYSYFMSFAGKKMTAFPSVKTICLELGFGSDTTYYKYLNQLKKRGLISSNPTKTAHGKFDRTVYKITLQKSDIEDLKSTNANTKITTEKNISNNTSPNKQKKTVPHLVRYGKPYPISPYTVNRGTKINNNIKINKEEEETTQRVEIDTEVIKKYKECISEQVSNAELKLLSELQEVMGKELVLKAIDIAMMKNGKNLGYIKAVLEDWKGKGLRTVEEVEQYLSEWSVKNQKAKENRKKQVERRARSIDVNEKRKITNFADYPGQRQYDYDKLEKKLLGWDKYD